MSRLSGLRAYRVRATAVTLALAFIGLGIPLSGCYAPTERQAESGRQDPQAPPRGGAEAPQDDGNGAIREEPDRQAWGDEPEPEPEGEARDAGAEANRLAREGGEALAEEDHARGARLLEQAIELAPERAVFWHNLAVAYYGMREFERAERVGRGAVDLAEDDLEVLREAWWIVAAARMEQGDRRGARDAAAAARQFGEVEGIEPRAAP